jgi:uncharacterized membrane protein
VHQRTALALTTAAFLWTLILVAAPVALTTSAFGVPAAAIYAASSRICHQRPERSFHLGGVQLPVCGRCFGLYLSGALGAVAAWGSRRRPGDAARAILVGAAIPTAVTWSTEMAGVAGFTNTTRALAAMPLGAAGGWVFVQMLRYDASLDGHEIHDSRSHVHGR